MSRPGWPGGGQSAVVKARVGRERASDVVELQRRFQATWLASPTMYHKSLITRKERWLVGQPAAWEIERKKFESFLRHKTFW